MSLFKFIFYLSYFNVLHVVCGHVGQVVVVAKMPSVEFRQQRYDDVCYSMHRELTRRGEDFRREIIACIAASEQLNNLGQLNVTGHGIQTGDDAMVDSNSLSVDEVVNILASLYNVEILKLFRFFERYVICKGIDENGNLVRWYYSCYDASLWMNKSGLKSANCQEVLRIFASVMLVVFLFITTSIPSIVFVMCDQIGVCRA